MKVDVVCRWWIPRAEVLEADVDVVNEDDIVDDKPLELK